MQKWTTSKYRGDKIMYRVYFMFSPKLEILRKVVYGYSGYVVWEKSLKFGVEFK
jgi:hypothetical protein